MDTINKMTISDASKVQYSYLLKRMDKAGFTPPTESDEQVDYVKEYLSTFDNVKVKLSMLNVCIVLRRELGLDTENLKMLRNDLSGNLATQQVTTLNEKRETLLDYQTLLDKLQKAYDEKQNVKFIMNYLFIHHAVRNLDVNLTIVKKKKDMGTTGNYLWYTPKKITYVRNDYKTVETYGQKTSVITDPRMLKVVRNMDGPLFPEGILSNHIRKYYLEPDLTESTIFKTVIHHYYHLGDSNAIKELASSRGTNLQTVEGFYNVNKVSNPILS